MELTKLIKSHPIYTYKFNARRRLCEGCGVKWYKPKSANSKYCSDKCRKLAQVEREKRCNRKRRAVVC